MVKYNKSVILVLKKSEEEAINLFHEEIDIEHFILGILSIDNNIKKLLNSFNISYDKYKKRLLSLHPKNEIVKFPFYSFNLKKMIDYASDNSLQFSSEEVRLEDIFINIFDINSAGLDILKSFNIDINLLQKKIMKSIKSNKDLLIYEIGTNLNELASSKALDKVIGRNKETEQLIEILARKNKNNPILIGEAGTGKTALVEGLAERIVSKEVPTFLKDKVIISLNIANVISGTKYRGEFEEKLTKVLKECETTDNIIIFIDEVHTIVGAGGAEGAIDASNILKPVLARGNIKIIGATTINEYKKYISQDKALDRRFQKIYIEEPSEVQTLKILKRIKKDYENFHNVKISEEMLKEIVRLSKKYINDRNEPDRSIDILDEVCASTNISSTNNDYSLKIKELNKIKKEKEKALKQNNYKLASFFKEEETKLEKGSNQDDNVVKKETIKKVIESKCNSKIYDLELSSNKYEMLENKLNKKIIGQNFSNNLTNIIKLFDNKKNNLPISVLFNGPIGCGKKYTIKCLSQFLNKNLITLNMNEFISDISINKLIGSPQGYVGYDDFNTVLEEVKLKPNSIILLDKLNEANENVINLFTNIFNTGYLKTSKNEKLYFNNCLFFITNNEINPSSIGYASKSTNEYSCDIFEKVNYVINFKPLSKSAIKKIVNNEINLLNSEYNKKLKLSAKEIESIINESKYEKLGASNIKKIVSKYLEKSLISSSTL